MACKISHSVPLKKVCKRSASCDIIELISQEADFLWQDKKRSDERRQKNIIGMLLEEYDIKSAKVIEDAIKVIVK